MTKEYEDIDFVTDAEEVNPALFNEVVVFGTDWTTETIDFQMQKSNILLDPPFQRRIAWREDRKSQFIESLIFGVPVPQILLFQGNDGKYIVLDGKQRLTTIQEFFAGSFSLQSMTLDTDLTGQNIDSLKTNFDEYYTHLCNRPIRTTVIKNCKHDSILHQIFLRVNTGSVSLSPQELRQALHPGDFVRFANSFTAQCAPLMSMLRIDEPDYRMRDVDIFVRTMAFHFYPEKYTGNMRKFLDETCDLLNKSWDKAQERVEKAAREFGDAIVFTQGIFGQEKAFCVWSESSYNRLYNRAVIDIMMYFFMSPEIRNTITQKKIDIESLFIEVSKQEDFLRSVSSSTNSTKSVTTRFQKWAEALNRVLPGLNVNSPFS